MPWRSFSKVFLFVGGDPMNEQYYMRLALTLAESGRGQTGINPLVGAVVVKDGRIVGTGAHLRRGEPHAEVHALQMAGAHAEGSTVYVTLEPCSHYGRTPPCAELLIHKNVRRVVIATLDPNPVVAGNGMKKLQEAGIEISVGHLEQEAIRMNEPFNKYIITKMPFITLKSAMTLDGKVATDTGDSRWISGEASRAEVHRLRHEHDAIMVGIGTIISDDPKLTTRMTLEGMHPTRIIIDSTLRIPLESQLLHDRSADTIILTTQGCDRDKKADLHALGVEIVEVNDGNRVDLSKAMKLIGEREIASVLVEGGATLGGALLDQHLVDKIVLYIAPKIIGGDNAPNVWRMGGIPWMKDAIPFRDVSYEQVGQDLRFIGFPDYERTNA
jgi:diaminohydroxyphosphoribosylaminopyrimidine deaminase/5-amino-6-(5-phosphoribosylamino)uracil reductase